MAFLEGIYRHGIWLSVLLFPLAAALLAYCILSLVRLGDATRVASLPLVEEQPVQLDEAAEVVLSLDGPRLSERFSGLAFELVAPDGKSVPGRTAWLHARSAGLSTVRMELVVFAPETPGQHRLRVKNLGAGRKDDAEHRIVFSRPHLPQTVGLILGIIFSAGALIGSIVLLALRLSGKGGPP